MDAALLPDVAEPLQKVDRMPLDRFIEAINRLREALFGRVPAMRARFLFERLPSSFFRILLRRVVREAYYTNPRLPLKPFFDFFMHQVRRAVEPHDYLAAPVLGHHHLEPPNSCIPILEVYRQGRYLFASPQMQCSINVFGILAARRRRHLWLLTATTPSLAYGPLQINACLIARKRDQALARIGKFFENL